MNTHDFYLERACGGIIEILADYELVIHGDEIINTHREALQGKENRRVEQSGRGVVRECSGKDAKNDTKKNAIKLKNDSTEYRDIFDAFSTKRCVPSAYSIVMRFSWILKTPFFSRAIDEFSAIDNPITRDTLSNYPVLHASGAKGILRGILHDSVESTMLERLFGNDREIKEQDEAQAGIVYPSDVVFTSKTKKEIFSPHVRKSQTADHPVSFEVVPKDAKAHWDVLLFDAFQDEKKDGRICSTYFESCPRSY